MQAARSSRALIGIEARERLLDAAEAAFAELGFHGATLGAIARAAGLSNPGLVHHYASKAALYLAVFDRIARDLTARTERARAGATTPRDRLAAHVAGHARWMAERPRASRMVLRELLDNVGRVPTAHALPLRPIVDALTAAVEDAQRAGSVPPGPALAIATQLLGALAYALAVRPTLHRMRPAEPLVADDARWLDAVAASVERTVLGGAP
jgi:TetR/AcrR family transcriptional regulator